MLIRKLLPFFMTVLLMLPTFASSEMQEMKEYKIKGGDTLWDISNKELQDPFLWPKIWKENPEIKNPDRIYPDQSIKIPLYLLQKEREEEAIPESVNKKAGEQVIAVVNPEPAPVVKINPIVYKNIYLASGYIVDSISSWGKITGSPEGRNLFGNNDLVYINARGTVHVGDKFYIIREGQKVFHPVTKQKMGHITEVLGIAEISKFEYGETIARILVSFQEIETGDLLDTYFAMEPPVVLKPFRKPNVEGYVVASKSLRIMNSSYNIVYIDKGEKDGLQAGDVLKTLSVGLHRVPNGTIQIISLKDNTSTAVIMSSTDAVTAGNQITQLE